MKGINSPVSGRESLQSGSKSSHGHVISDLSTGGGLALSSEAAGVVHSHSQDAGLDGPLV